MHLAYVTFTDSDLCASTDKSKLIKIIFVMAGFIICTWSVLQNCVTPMYKLVYRCGDFSKHWPTEIL